MGKAPLLQKRESLKEKAVRRPQPELSIGSGQLANGQCGNLVQGHGAIMARRRPAGTAIAVGPGRIDVEGTELLAGLDQAAQIGHGCAGKARSG